MNSERPMRVTRRRFCQVSGLSTGAAMLAGRPLLAAQEGIIPKIFNAAAKAKIVTHALRRNLSILEGSGGNIAVLTGKDGTLMVDAGFSVSRRGVADALKAINAGPLRHLVNTHWHFDHTDGNQWLHASGAAITAHENTRRRMSVATRVEGWQWTFPAAPEAARPVTVFDDVHEIRFNDTRIAMQYCGPAHTDSDIRVHFTEADVVHLGDTWWNGVYPFIDYSTGGSIDGQIRAAEATLAAFTDRTVFIPGHGPAGSKSDVAEFRDMLVTIRENVAALKRQGRSLSETVAARPTQGFDAKWANFPSTPATFTGLVYQGV